MNFSRRTILKGTASLALAGATASAACATGRLRVGDAELTVVSDGFMKLPIGFALPDVPAGEVHDLLSSNGLSTDALVNDCNVTLLRRGDRLAIFDVGAGPNFLPTTGRLSENIESAGVDPEDVTDVIFTHAHPDHIWGLVDDFDELVFPNASYRISGAEWDFWSSDKALETMPDDRKTFAVGARNRFAAIEDRVEFFKPGDEVFEGTEAVDTAGHTPGHTSFAVHGTGETILIAGDAVTNLTVSLGRPDWPSGSDQDPEMGIKTRVALLERVASDRTRLIGFHFPHPGGGSIERANGAYRFVAL